MGCSGVPVPGGLTFPTRSVGGSGPAALLSGTLVVRAGCLHVVPETGDAYVVVWPDHLALRIDVAGVPVIMDGSTEVARVGGEVHIGGGEQPAGLPAVPGCPGLVWLGTEVVIPDDAPAVD